MANWGNQEFFSEVKAETEYVKKLLQQEVISGACCEVRFICFFFFPLFSPKRPVCCISGSLRTVKLT